MNNTMCEWSGARGLTIRRQRVFSNKRFIARNISNILIVTIMIKFVNPDGDVQAMSNQTTSILCCCHCVRSAWMRCMAMQISLLFSLQMIELEKSSILEPDKVLTTLPFLSLFYFFILSFLSRRFSFIMIR